MRILIAPAEFKGTLQASEVARALADGIASAWPEAECELLPLSDGGPGLVEALVTASGGERRETSVTGPLGEKRRATWGLLPGKVAVIDMAEAAGLSLLSPEQYDPLRTTTRGVGELIAAAVEAQAEEVLIGAGGSATNDGGAGALAALGVKFLDEHGAELEDGGGALAKLAAADFSVGLRLRSATLSLNGNGEVSLVVLTDVTNPLTGPFGASAIFGPQKGATPSMVSALDEALGRFSRVLAQTLGQDLSTQPGAGAAGGLAFGLTALGARIRPGFEHVAQVLSLDSRVSGADWVLTGEGRFDGQTAFGKAPSGVAQMARTHHKRCVLFAGRIDASTSGCFDEAVEVTPRDKASGLTKSQARSLVAAAGRAWASKKRMSVA
jgi:glycerate kinase